MFKENLAIIIPTKDRPDEIRRLFKSISDQELKPAQVIVVDGGKVSIEDMLKQEARTPVNYVRLIPASLTAQRNAGIKRVRDDVTIVAFLDDDVVLEKESVKNMVKFWETATEDTAGAAFNITNLPDERVSILEKIFCVNSEKPNVILHSGFQSKNRFLTRTEPVKWLVGCAMVWRKSIFKEFMFDEFFRGYARYEEVDFAYRVGRKYKLYIVADARAAHLNSLENPNFSFTLGKMEIVNRLYFVRKNPDLSLSLCLWACMGFFLNNTTKGLFRFNRRYILRSTGNLAGFMEALLKGLLR